MEPVATGVTGQDVTYKISTIEKYYTKCFDNDKKSIKGIEECVKVDILIQKEATKTRGSKKHVVSSDSYQSFIRFSSEPTKWVEEKQMDPWFEYLMSSKHMDKWNIGDKDERSVHAKMCTESLADPKMEEQKLQSDCTSASFSKEARCFKFSFKESQFNQHTSYQGLCCTKG